ncbi:MAG: prepilin peptidase [Propionibacteriaceae bacterium]|jgi:leader peptidase (prepilin peptidase)/N-methyltransferase|nr:prepilin peptidase [Propionibacteriaceae bacterium]
MELILIAAACLLAAAASGLSAQVVLRRLPPPAGEDFDYAALATTRTRLAAAGATAAGLALVLPCHDWTRWPLWTAFALGGGLLAVVDAQSRFIPRQVAWATGGAVVLTAAGAAALDADPWPLLGAAGGAAVAGGVLWALWRLGGGLGFGDVRLAAIIGWTTGFDALSRTIIALILGAVLAALWGWGRRLRGNAEPYPFGPALVGASFVAAAWPIS